MAKQSNGISEELIWDLLQEVKDPEMPSVSMVEMGMINKVVIDKGIVSVEVMPTFVGCPALGIMKNTIVQQLNAVEGVQEIRVDFVYDPAWSSNRINEDGREKLRQFGIAPPPLDHQIGDPWNVDCPFCGSPYTSMDNLFGPAACRSILYCKTCKNPFEALKPI